MLKMRRLLGSFPLWVALLVAFHAAPVWAHCPLFDSGMAKADFHASAAAGSIPQGSVVHYVDGTGVARALNFVRTEQVEGKVYLVYRLESGGEGRLLLDQFVEEARPGSFALEMPPGVLPANSDLVPTVAGRDGAPAHGSPRAGGADAGGAGTPPVASADPNATNAGSGQARARQAARPANFQPPPPPAPRAVAEVSVRPNRVEGTIEYRASEVSVPSPIRGESPRIAAKSAYSVSGRPAEQVLQESLHTDAPLQRLGTGGMQDVFVDPTDPARVAKVYDGNVMYDAIKRGIAKSIAKGEELVESGDTAKITEGRKMISEAQEEEQAWQQSIPAGKSYPPKLDELIARMIQRQKALGPGLRNEVLPRIQIPRPDGAGNIRVTMCEGLENVSATGTSQVERVHFGPVDAANPRSDVWVDPEKYLENLPEGSPRFQKIQDADAAWRKAMAPYNEEVKGANQAFGLGKLNKGGKLLGYDLAEGSHPFTNVALRLDAEGNVVEIKVIDY